MSIRRVGSSPVSRTRSLFEGPHFPYARVVELADSLDSGSSVHYGRAGSSPASRTNSSQAICRLRRVFSFHCKAHRALILPLLASKPDPLSLGLGPPLCGGFFLSQGDIDSLPARRGRHAACAEFFAFLQGASRVCGGVFLSFVFSKELENISEKFTCDFRYVMVR